MKKKIPKFKSEKEAAEFWSKHSPLDYSGEFKEAKDAFKFSVEFLERIAEEHREKKKSITLRIEPSQIILAKIIAKKRGDYYQALLRKWILHGIQQTLSKYPKIKNAIRKENLHLLKR